MSLDLDALLAPPTPTAALALETVRRWSSPALVEHGLRSWAWARLRGDALGLDYDAELLYVAAMLHDLGVSPAFDAHETAFEQAGGAAAWAFAAGAGWPHARRERVREVIERHMWLSVDPDLDAEGHLLEVATSLDVSGTAPDLWDVATLRAVEARHPRSGFTAEFAGCIHAQARRKPASAAARLDASVNIAAGGAVWEAILGGAGEDGR
ncbi:MAG: cyanamide hydratase [Microbacterium arborescens]